MTDTDGGGFGLASSMEEVALRRKLLFRLLRSFDFSHPELHSELIADMLPARGTAARRPTSHH
ncbi:MAG: hypothetical protein CSA74_06875 [Rhodobacterales bacterium]|nr:MAG: hypothetical protein CSA74_06875 [Rhodobacterales bacterium]